jgi:hypothetical protein
MDGRDRNKYTKGDDFPAADILKNWDGERDDIIFDRIQFLAVEYDGWTDREERKIHELLQRGLSNLGVPKYNAFAEIAAMFPRYRKEFSATEPSELLGNMPPLPENPTLKERFERFVWLNIWGKRRADTLAEKLSDERTLRLSQIDKAIDETMRQLDTTGFRKQMDKPIDLAVFQKLLGSERTLALSEDYIIDEAGIFAVPPEGALLEKELIEYEKNARDIYLEFPCAYADIKKWAERNDLIDALMANELIAGANPKTPLTKDDKKAQDERIIRNGAPTVSLRDFVDEILGDELEDFDTLPTFYRLVEEYGLVVYDGVVDSNIVSSKDLLIALRHREQEADEAFGDASFYFWKPFLRPSGNEVGYTLFRDDVAQAYHNAGKPYFPWLDWHGDKVELKVKEHITVDNTWEFGLAAKPEDYQDAFKQDAWTWQEALCWLKGRFPDETRLGQLGELPEKNRAFRYDGYYQEDRKLICKAIDANVLTEKGSSPQQWVEWARKKGWGIPPLIEQYLPLDEVSADKEEKLETVNVESQKLEQPDETKGADMPINAKGIVSTIKERKCKNETDALILLNAALDEMQKKNGKTPGWTELAAYVLNSDFKHSNIRSYDVDAVIIKNRKLTLTNSTVLDREGIRRRYKETIFPLENRLKNRRTSPETSDLTRFSD